MNSLHSGKKTRYAHRGKTGKIQVPIVLLSLLAFACGDDYPPCSPEGDGPGTIYGPTPSPLPGPGGPNDPPDWADAPPKYSKTEDGEICTCGPYQPGCTADPGAVSGNEYGTFAPETSNCGSSCPSNTAADQQRMMQDMVNGEAVDAGGVICAAPEDCVTKCNLEAKYCVAAYSTHPYKPGPVGHLFDCLDSFPKAKYGGSYACLYQYPSGDVCVFAYGSKFGPITIPAPPPLCVYKKTG